MNSKSSILTLLFCLFFFFPAQHALSQTITGTGDGGSAQSACGAARNNAFYQCPTTEYRPVGQCSCGYGTSYMNRCCTATIECVGPLKADVQRLRELRNETHLCNQSEEVFWFPTGLDLFSEELNDIRGWVAVHPGQCEAIGTSTSPWVAIKKNDQIITPIDWDSIGRGKTKIGEVFWNQDFKKVRSFWGNTRDYPCDDTNDWREVTFQELPHGELDTGPFKWTLN